MTVTQQAHVEFWTQLENSYPEVFNAKPQIRKIYHFYELMDMDLAPFKIRLNIYFDESDVKKWGHTCISVMYKATSTTTAIQLCFPKEELKYKDLRLYCASTEDSKYDVNDENNWPYAIDWFAERVRMIKEVLARKKQ